MYNSYEYFIIEYLDTNSGIFKKKNNEHFRTFQKNVDIIWNILKKKIPQFFVIFIQEYLGILLFGIF